MTTSHTSDGTWRSLSRGAVTAMALALVMVASACSDSSPSATTAVGSTPSSTVATSIGTVVVADSDVDTTSIGDAGQVLLAAIAAIGTRYEFDTSVDLTGGTLTLVTGRVYDDSSAYLITTVGSELEYVITPQGRWVHEPGDPWVALQDAAPLISPLSILVDPIAIEVLAVDGADVTLAATYSGETLGFPDTEQVTVEFLVTDSRLASLRYEAAAGPDTATVETEILETLDVEPVIAPVPTG